MEFGQFCPIAKSAEIIGEKWTMLIIRELLMGSTRFSELQRGLSLISPALLTKRLQMLADYGLLVKKKIVGQKGYEYFPTNSAKELLPIFIDIGNWGMRWTRQYLTSNDFDPDFLMLYLKRSIQTENLPGNETIVKFNFTDIEQQPNWWIIVNGQVVDLCTIDPGREVDVYFTCTVKCLSDVWMGESTYPKEINNGSLKIVGRSELTKNISSWLHNCMFAKQKSTL
ncbi:winged helix-turn-helix transcriptional regulator [Paraglaciecola hydrolytica]|uniref:HxlR family transcriptional regulator n=1 Tax=Paraglaciecola hydrolytica TaxID=1799789 RepID=A0A136A6U8_9ALTE|nr:helix-turn-helix domain-containing protein [Paraglaciecola hydrolytica]KXI30959.1 HxlR family transcriptional regulator [Paraglaciecola hydrolytica]